MNKIKRSKVFVIAALTAVFTMLIVSCAPKAPVEESYGSPDESPAVTQAPQAAEGSEISADAFFADTSELFRIGRYVQGVPDTAVYYGYRFPALSEYDEAADAAQRYYGRRVTFRLNNAMTAEEIPCRALESEEDQLYVWNTVISADYKEQVDEAPFCSLSITVENEDGSSDEYSLDGEYYLYRQKAESGYEKTAEPLNDTAAMHLYAIAIRHIHTKQNSRYMLTEENICAYVEFEGKTFTLTEEDTRELMGLLSLPEAFEGTLSIADGAPVLSEGEIRIAFYNGKTDDPANSTMFLCITEDGSAFVLRKGFGLSADQYVYNVKAVQIISSPDTFDHDALEGFLNGLS